MFLAFCFLSLSALTCNYFLFVSLLLLFGEQCIYTLSSIMRLSLSVLRRININYMNNNMRNGKSYESGEKKSASVLSACSFLMSSAVYCAILCKVLSVFFIWHSIIWNKKLKSIFFLSSYLHVPKSHQVSHSNKVYYLPLIEFTGFNIIADSAPLFNFRI